MSTEPTRRSSGGSVHRLLDEAFAGIEMTPDTQDLKEEIRANLAARAEELEAAGRSPEQAARDAVDELGDIRAIIADGHDDASRGRSSAADHLRHRVRPRPAFVVRTVLLSLVAFAGLATIVLDAIGVVEASVGLLVACVAAVALPMGIVTADALRQETSSSFPLPRGRAVGFGIGVALVIAGLGIGWLVVQGIPSAWLVLGAAVVVGGIALLAYLGATKTNRHKPWVLQHAGEYEFEDRFSTDPAAAARFGIYTAVLWVGAFALFIVLTSTVGWAWSWLVLVGGFLLMMLILARMLFPPKG